MNKFDVWLLKAQFGKNSRLRTYRKLARYHENGVQLQESLKQIISQETRDGKKPKAPIAFAAAEWLRRIENGSDFGDAIRGWVPSADVVIIDAGDKAGRIGDALHNACLITESNGRIRAEVLKATLYPVALLFGAFAFMAFFGLNVVPAFDEVYPKENWTGVGAQMAWMADFVQTGLLPLIGFLIAMAVLLFWSMPRWTGKVRVRLDKMPPYSIYRLMTGSSFLLSMAAMIGAGIHVPEGVRIMLRNSNPWLRERLSRVLFFIRDGYDLGDSLYRINMDFPDYEIVNDLRAYSKMKGFNEMLLQIGKQAIDDTVGKIAAQAAVMRNVGIVFIGLVFMWIAVGLFSVQQQLMSALQQGG